LVDQASGSRHAYNLEPVIARFSGCFLERTVPANNGTDDTVT
jgi:hypothetical protein